MIEPPRQRLLLAQLEAQSKRGVIFVSIERKITGHAERLTITDRAKRRQHGRHALAGRTPKGAFSSTSRSARRPDLAESTP